MKKDIRVLVRKSTMKDLSRLAVLGAELAEHHNRFDKIYRKGKETLSVHKSYFVKTLKRRDSFACVIEVNEEIVGFATVTIKKMSPVFALPHMGHIDNIFIQKRYRKLGLGKLAIEQCFDWLRSKRITEVDLSVDIKNVTSVQAWHKLGFHDWRFIMRRKL